MLGLALSSSSGCGWWQELTDRPQCDDALDVICSCPSRPCDRANPPAIVKAMRRCHEDDVRPDDYEGNVHICIADEGRAFCKVLDGMVRDDGSLCDASCAHACSPSMTRSCERYHYQQCDLPGAAGVGGAAP
jgi:hypothetical protein